MYGIRGCSNKKRSNNYPARLRKKFRIEEGTRLEVVETQEGILFKPKKSFWDLMGSGAPYASVEEVKKGT
jgi:AbrB family looped-hinge helix DNA binding protein